MITRKFYLLIAAVLIPVAFLCISSAFAQSPSPAQEIPLLEDFPEEGAITTTGGAIGIVEQYVKKVYIFGTALVSVVAVIWIIIGGYEIMFSGAVGAGGNQNGKAKITQALLGLVLLFLAALILHTINPGFFTYNNQSAVQQSTAP